MLICVSCNVEYEEDKKFCSYCGGPLSPKAEALSAQKKVNRVEEKESGGKLICSNCKITYEFGSSCIQCGSPLVRQSFPLAKEESETIHGTESEEKLPPLETLEEQKTVVPPKKLICPNCKIIYEHGESCIKCESALVPQTSSPSNEEAEISGRSEVEEESLQVHTIQEQFKETPRPKLICPDCKIIYERGSSCVRCGAGLVSQTALQEKKKPPLPKGDEISPLHLQPEDKGHTLGQISSAELPKASGRGLGLDLDWPPLSSPKGQDGDITHPSKRKETRFASTPEVDVTEESSQARTPEQPSTQKSADDLNRIGTFLEKVKKDYRRLFLEAGSVIIMVLAGGYFLWSVYSHFVTKPPEPRAPASKDQAGQILPSSSSPVDRVPTVTESGKSKNTQGTSSMSKEAVRVPIPEASKPPSVEIQEMGNIKTLLEKIRRANLQEDIDLFISCYASDFTNKEEKRRATLANWRMFNYLDLSYDVKKTSISQNTAEARIEWVIKTSSKAGGRPQENKSLLDVTFKKEKEGWKIEDVKPAR